MEVVGWRAYYDGFRVFDSSDCNWTDLPDEGIVGVVVFKTPPYREIVDGGDWFYIEDNIPRTTDTADEWGEWVNPPGYPDSIVKQGKVLPDEEWEAFQWAMRHDKSWP